MSRSSNAFVSVTPGDDTSSATAEVSAVAQSTAFTPLEGVTAPQTDSSETSAAPTAPLTPPPIPDYLENTYHWAYLAKFATWLFDHQWSVNTILWGNANRLIRLALSCLQPGQNVMQPAAVYGHLSREMAKTLGPQGHLTVGDVAPIQVELTTRKLAAFAHAEVVHCDATTPNRGPYDTIVCFFLLHEVPEDIKTEVVDALMTSIRPGGRIVFVDYHEPSKWHPLRPIMVQVFKYLEPFARALWTREIADYASKPLPGTWRKDTIFGGMYQRVIFDQIDPPNS